MPEKIFVTKDAVFVSQAFPDVNFSFLKKIKVGNNLYFPQESVCFPRLGGKNIGLVQFEGFLLPKNSEIERVRLYLFVLYTKHSSETVFIHPNESLFDKENVTYITRPFVNFNAKACLLVDKCDCFRYVSVDITDFIKTGQNGSVLPLSLSLFGYGALSFSASFEKHPPYLEVVYKKGKNDPCHFDTAFAKNVYFEKELGLSGEGTVFSENINLSRANTVTFFIKNLGDVPFLANLQYSHDEADFIDDPQVLTVAPLETKMVTPYMFSKFIRVKLSSPNAFINAKIICQIQTYNYAIN